MDSQLEGLSLKICPTFVFVPPAGTTRMILPGVSFYPRDAAIHEETKPLSELRSLVDGKAVSELGAVAIDLRDLPPMLLTAELQRALAEYLLGTIASLHLSYPLLIIIACQRREEALAFRNARITADQEEERRCCEVVWAKDITEQTAIYQRLADFREAFPHRRLEPDLSLNAPNRSMRLALRLSLGLLMWRFVLMALCYWLVLKQIVSPIELIILFLIISWFSEYLIGRIVRTNRPRGSDISAARYVEEQHRRLLDALRNNYDPVVSR